MESLDSNLPRQDAFISTKEIKDYLLETAKWGKFLAIVGFVGIGLMILAAFFVMVGSSQLDSLTGGMGVPMGMIGLVYIVFAAFYFFPVYYLYQFSVKIKQGLISQDSHGVAAGFQNLKSLYKFMGIFTIVIISIYALVLVIAIGAGMMA